MNNNRIARWSGLGLGAILCSFLMALSLPAQTPLGTSSVGGEVRDKTGLVVTGASVELKDLSHGTLRNMVTSDTGSYLFPALAPGFYTLTFSKEGFKTTTISNFRVVVRQSAVIHATLEIGVVTQSITVNAGGAAVLLDTTSDALGTVVDDKRVESLPLNGRNFLQLGLITAGTTQPQGQGDIIAGQYNHPGRAINLSGNFEGVTSFIIDGIEARGNRLGELVVSLSIADIDQFKVNQSSFMPDQGPDPGIISVYTKSGSNQLHGEAFEFVRNQDFDARNFFATSPEPLHRNQFGGALGGPIVIPHVINGTDKLWFHVYYEGQRQIERTVQSAFTPTQAMFNGDFSAIPQQLYNPFQFDPATGLREAFQGNQIPTGLINPVAKKLLAFYLPGSSYATRPNNVFGNPAQILQDDQFGTRVDIAISPRQSLFGNFLWDNNPFDVGSLMPHAGRLYPSNSQLAVLQHTFSISPQLVNVARIGWSRSLAYTRGEPSPSPTLASDNGITNTFDQTGLPEISPEGYSSFGTTVGKIGNTDERYQLDEGLNYIRGKHTFQFGTGIRYTRTIQLNNNGDARGGITFSGQYTSALTNTPSGLGIVPDTGDGFADFLLGLPLNGSVSQLPPIPFRFTQWSPYLQDVWKVTPSFTLDYGISWYYSNVPNPQGTTARNMVADLDFATGLLQYAALGQVSPQLLSPTYHDVTPRIGFAWQPSFLKNTVIRSGVGVYFEDSRLIEAQDAFEAPPFGAPTQFSNNPASTTLPSYFLGQNVFQAPLPQVVSSTFAANIPPGTYPNLENQYEHIPYVTQWNFSVQHTFGRNDLVEADYLGTSGHKQQNRYEADQCLPTATLFCDPATRPYQLYTGILMMDNNGNINYDALALKYRHQFSRGLTFLSEYTYSKTLSDSFEGNAGTQSQIGACRRCDRGPTTSNVPQILTISTLYDLPFGRGRYFGSQFSKAEDLIFGGWGVTGILTFETGNSFTLQSPSQTPFIFAEERPDRLCNGHDSSLSGNLRSDGDVWFNAACFQTPALNYYGTSGRGIMSGPGVNNWDLGLHKQFALGDRAHVDIRSEFFNAWNHAQFDNPNTNSASLTFGQVSAARTPREIQLALRLAW